MGSLLKTRDSRRAVAVAGSCAALGLLARSATLPAPVAVLTLGAGLVGASLLLSWAADAAEVELSGGLILAILTLVTVLPELLIELHFVHARQLGLITANLTGATRLLLTGATAMPVVTAALLAFRGKAAQEFTLPPARRADLAVLFAAAGYGILIALLGRISLVDGTVFVALYLYYLRRIRGTPSEPPAVVGVSAELAALPPRQRRPLLAAFFVFSAAVVVMVATPFAQALQMMGISLGLPSYLLVQSIAPAATEMPEFVVAIVLVMHRRPKQAIAVFLAASVVQWTLAIGILPWARVAAGGASVLPLTTRGSVELALSASTTLMAIAALTSFDRTRTDAGIVLTLFAIQFLFPAVEVRLVVAVVLAILAISTLIANHRRVHSMPAARRSGELPPTPPE